MRKDHRRKKHEINVYSHDTKQAQPKSSSSSVVWREGNFDSRWRLLPSSFKSFGETASTEKTRNVHSNKIQRNACFCFPPTLQRQSWKWYTACAFQFQEPRRTQENDRDAESALCLADKAGGWRRFCARNSKYKHRQSNILCREQGRRAVRLRLKIKPLRV